jgi:hypothetical protein
MKAMKNHLRHCIDIALQGIEGTGENGKRRNDGQMKKVDGTTKEGQDMILTPLDFLPPENQR